MSLVNTFDVLPRTTTRTPEYLALTVDGAFDAETVLMLRTVVVQAVADGAALILLDLGSVTRITPSAVAGMLEFLRMTRASGGDFRVYGDSRALQSAHDALRLTSVLRVYRTQSDAILSGL